MTNTIVKKPGFFAKLWKEQKKAAYSDAQRQFWSETVQGYKRVLALKANEPTRIETFDEAVVRLSLSPKDLVAQERRFKVVHLVLYALAGALMVYALHMALNVHLVVGLAVLVSAAGIATQGYLVGFRAWQIQNRNLIRLQDAIRIPGTYLVL